MEWWLLILGIFLGGVHAESFSGGWVTGLADAGDGRERFAIHHGLVLEGEGPWYRLDLPVSQRLATRRSDQTDVRVFDANGKPMPFSLLRPQTEVRVSERREGMAMFPLFSDSPSDENPLPRVRLESNARGTLIEVVAEAGELRDEGGTRRGWLLDLSDLEGQIVRLLLDWPEGEADGFQRFAIEGSDDLEAWRPLGSGQTVNTTFRGERIDQREVALPGLRSRYLRLIWLEPGEAPALQRISVVTGQTLASAPPLNWSSPLTATRDAEGDYRLELPNSVRVERLRIELPQLNTLASLEVSGGYLDREGREVWSPLGSGRVYRFPVEGREAEQNEIALSPRAFSRFRLHTGGERGGLDMPRLKVKLGMQPLQLVFFAGGEPPYRLAVGNPDAPPADLPMEILMPKIEGEMPAPGVALLGDALGVPGPAEPGDASAGPRAAWEWKNFLLWGALFVGVVLLGFMSLHILRSSRR